MEVDLSTLAAHAGARHEHGGPSATPIHPASFYLSAGDPADVPYAYGRHGNPTWEALESALGQLESARALVFASGQAASLALVLALATGATTTAVAASPGGASLGARRRFVLPHDGYYGTRKLADLLRPLGIEPVIVDMTELVSVERALTAAPSVLWAESPTNPYLRVLDLRALATLAKGAGSPFVVDNTTATAALQRPLDLGADATITSLTKAVSGHSDVVLGAIATRKDSIYDAARNWRANAGLIAGPFEAWAALRGLKTLPLRLARQSESALALAEHLVTHPKVARVHHPAVDPRSRALAERQMSGGFGPLLSFEVRGGADEADRVVAAARLIRPGTSFGGVESSWERRARWTSETAPPNLIRLSVGIEAVADLSDDLDRALA
ncbi:MAG: PLP-dependent transferase, partial [Planctomycetes bacterium]|nr:PLP-dependent transferase [Planctomycetota bacterium]